MNYYNEIKNKLIDNEIVQRVKNYSKNKDDLDTYYEVGKLLVDAGRHYGEGIIKQYSLKLTNELCKKYNYRYLFDMKKLYLFSKVHPLDAQLTMSHYRLLFSIKNDNKINYYIDISLKYNLSKRQLRERIISREYVLII